MFYCNKDFSDTKDMRPYGPNYSLICFDCATLPEHEKETAKNFDNQLFEAMKKSNLVIIGSSAGPLPIDIDAFEQDKIVVKTGGN